MGYLGMVGGPNPCAVQIISPYAGRPIAFHQSPYGVTSDIGYATKSLVPYLIDPATLDIEFREDLLIGPFSEQLGMAAVLDDSTMVFAIQDGGTSRLRVLTRSGITIAMSGEQQSVAIHLSAFVIRLDSSHVLRSYTVPTTQDSVVQVFSVSGSTLSLVTSTTWPATAGGPVTRDGGEAGTPTLAISPLIFPFHWDGSGTLYCWGSAFFSRVHAAPFTIGGGITAPGLSWRSRDAQVLTFFKRTGKIGSSECLVLGQSGGPTRGFYDTGSQMQFNGNTMSTSIADNGYESAFGDYLSPDVSAFPAGTPTPPPNPHPAIISQSGTTLSYASITPIVRCFNDPNVNQEEIGGSFGSTRHDTALGATAQFLGSAFSDAYQLWAFQW